MFWKLSLASLLLALLGCLFAGCGGDSSDSGGVKPPGSGGTNSTATMTFEVRSTSGTLFSQVPNLKVAAVYGQDVTTLAIKTFVPSSDSASGRATMTLSGAPAHVHSTFVNVYWLYYFIDTNNDNKFQDTEPHTYVREYSSGDMKVLYYDPATSWHPGWNVYWWPQDGDYVSSASGLFVNSRISIF